MAESMDSLFRRGAISAKAAGKLNALKGTKHQNSKMADFDEKSGVRDQGGTRDRGVAEAGNRHIDKKQDMGSPARASGKPSAGGSVQGSKVIPNRGEIDQGAHQKPDFPRGSKDSAANDTPVNKRVKGKIAKQGGQYGGGGQDTQ